MNYFHLEREKYFYPPRYVKLNGKMPFLPDPKQIIYIEDKYNPLFNKFIEQHYEKINELFRRGNYNFVFIPLTIKKIRSGNAVQYYQPNLKDKFIHYNKLSPQKIYDFLIGEEINIKPGFIQYQKTQDTVSFFSYFQIPFFEEEDLWKQLHFYIDRVSVSQNIFSQPKTIRREPGKGEDADDDFPTEAKKLVAEIQERIGRLQQIGINEMVLKSLFSFDSDRKLSRMVITKDYRIVLPDYNAMEIQLSPLPKAVFFLFLKYPEGILFKHLSNYKEELMNIYLKLSNRESLADMEKSIDDVIDPTKNAINEKCSRIREAFVKEFDETLAQHYFILGDRQTPKRIVLDRELLTIEADI
jgi:hypothetical protein